MNCCLCCPNKKISKYGNYCMKHKRNHLIKDNVINYNNFTKTSSDYLKNDIYNTLSENCTVGDKLKKIKRYKKNIKVEFVSSPIMNQLSYHVDKNKLNKQGLFLKRKIEVDIKNTLNLLKNIS